MAYQKNDWKTGDVITAEKLNNIEDGVKNAFSPYVVNFTFHDDGDHVFVTCDKTYQEIEDARSRNVCIAIVDYIGAFEFFPVLEKEIDEATNKPCFSFKNVEVYNDSNQTDKVTQLSVSICRVFEDGTVDYNTADTLFE